MKSIILFELNEVPFRILDYYVGKRPQSALARVMSHCVQFETYTEDTLALDPWISWPTFHRGIPDSVHGILHLGQVLSEIDEEYPPVWHLLKKAGVSVGVFGSLHSSSLPEDASEYDFYLPDYFATEAFGHPKVLEPFQQLNLGMTRASARNVSRRLPVLSAMKFISTAPRLGVRAATVGAVAQQLAAELFNRRARIRRRNLQPLLSADLFLAQVRRAKPQFSTFYSNHVAAAMHRYWGAAFPTDIFSASLDDTWTANYRDEIVSAMDTFDKILDQLVRLVDKSKNHTLVVASSMGQEAISADHTTNFMTITDLPNFMASLGIEKEDWESRPAMIPCQCVVVSEAARRRFLEGLRAISIDGNRMKESVRPSAPMSFDERQRGFFQLYIQFDSYGGKGLVELGNEKLHLASLGVGSMAHEDGVNCTAQHVKEGSLLVYSKSSATSGPERRKISTLDFVPSVLSHFGIPLPAYLKGAASIGLQ